MPCFPCSFPAIDTLEKSFQTATNLKCKVLCHSDTFHTNVTVGMIVLLASAAIALSIGTLSYLTSKGVVQMNAFNSLSNYSFYLMAGGIGLAVLDLGWVLYEVNKHLCFIKEVDDLINAKEYFKTCPREVSKMLVHQFPGHWANGEPIYVITHKDKDVHIEFFATKAQSDLRREVLHISNK